LTAPALGVVPPLPEGYTYENQGFIYRGVRMNIAHKGTILVEVEQTMKYVPEFDDPVGIQYVTRATNGHDRLARPIEDPHPWVAYPDMKTLVSAVLARHRLGVKA
jgi:hypothetical protein